MPGLLTLTIDIDLFMKGLAWQRDVLDRILKVTLICQMASSRPKPWRVGCVLRFMQSTFVVACSDGSDGVLQAKYLAGQGVARQRQAIINGLRDSIKNFSNEVDDVNPKDVIEMMMITQYFDMLRDVGSR